MKDILVEPHYLPSIEYFTLLIQCEKVEFDLTQSFKKQTFRNRTTILTANGIRNLVVPVKFKHDTPYAEVRIDHDQSWARDHWGAFYSSYGKAPFFEHFADAFKAIWETKFELLHELNQAMLSACLDIVQWQLVTVKNLPETERYDLRNTILAKTPYDERGFYAPKPYYQNFGNTFVPNLSVLDLILCQGSDALSVIKSSIKGPIERFMR